MIQYSLENKHFTRWGCKKKSFTTAAWRFYVSQSHSLTMSKFKSSLRGTLGTPPPPQGGGGGGVHTVGENTNIKELIPNGEKLGYIYNEG